VPSVDNKSHHTTGLESYKTVYKGNQKTEVMKIQIKQSTDYVQTLLGHFNLFVLMQFKTKSKLDKGIQTQW